MAVARFPLSQFQEGIDALRKAVGNPDDAIWNRILKQIGIFLVTEATAAFNNQRLGTFKWPERYPNQKAGEKVNVAGIVSDLSQGKKPPARRFEARPAGIDTSDTLRSLSMSSAVQKVGFAVTVRAGTPYSKRVQEGGQSTQAIDEQVRLGLTALLKKRPELRKRLGFLYSTDTLETTVNARPFLGVTSEAQTRIMRIVDENLSAHPWILKRKVVPVVDVEP